MHLHIHRETFQYTVNSPTPPPGPLKRNIEDVFLNEFYFINYFISKFQIKYVIDSGYIFALVTQYNYFICFTFVRPLLWLMSHIFVVKWNDLVLKFISR